MRMGLNGDCFLSMFLTNVFKELNGIERDIILDGDGKSENVRKCLRRSDVKSEQVSFHTSS